MNDGIPIESILELYLTKKWPVARIATHLYVSREAIYQRLRKQRIKLEKRPNSGGAKFSASQLEDLYWIQKLTLAETAARLDVSAFVVAYEMKRHGIARRDLREIKLKRPSLDSLDIGDSFLIERGIGQHPGSSLYREAKRLGIRITINRVGKYTMRVLRTG